MQDIYRIIMGENAPKWRETPPAGIDYTALMRRVTALLPESGDADITTPEGYAISRMNTLSKKPDLGCPDDEGVRRALWYALGAAAFPDDPRRTRTRRKKAVQAALMLTHGVPPGKREALRSRCGGPAKAIAKLISVSI